MGDVEAGFESYYHSHGVLRRSYLKHWMWRSNVMHLCICTGLLNRVILFEERWGIFVKSLMVKSIVCVV
ncbi:hypothetical protein KFK09_003639 [Dendrobium nobile]|uniref:Uncharacterized protein n=1 Tax=Dendrobium nobile TaxID=94219 RepID=A0A8T3C0P0_DENNO|nr:hypothetical protein KFK09_003639 [Dendrobium nobile]